MPDTLATTEDMTAAEGARLIVLEREVEKAMRSAGRIAGAALMEIRDQRLYRASHRSFEDYLLERHGISKSTGYAMISEARQANGLSPAANAIASASAKAAERRHMTLDQPPAVIDPPSEPLQEAPEPDEEDDGDAEGTVHHLTPPSPFPESVTKRIPTYAREGHPPSAEREQKIQARNALNRLVNILAAWEGEWEVLARAANKTERLLISKLAAACAVEDRNAAKSRQIATPEDCDHPVTRIVGNQCGKCGAVRKGAGR